MTPPRVSSALPPPDSCGASPKAISGRTSYLRVRLEFLRYPHLIPTLFNGCGFGPPLPLTAASAWARVGHPVSGLPLLTDTPDVPVLRPIKARFPCGSALHALNLARSGSSPDRSTKSTRSRPCGAPTACGRRVSGSLSLPSRGPFHLSLTVLCSIGHWVVFSLTGWSPLFPAGFLVSRGTLDPAVSFRVSLTGLSPSPAGLSSSVPLPFPNHLCGPNPGVLRTPVWAPPVSLAATPGITFVFSSSGYLDVSVRRVPLRALWIHARMHKVSLCGFPHSDTRGSQGMCPSPRLFAAYRVFHRLPVPRHPPCAFPCLTSCTARRSGMRLCGCLSFRARVALLGGCSFPAFRTPSGRVSCLFNVNN